MDFEDSVTQTQIEPIEDEGLLYSRSEGMNDGPPDEEHWGKLICNTDDEETTNLDTGTLPGPCVLYLKRKESNASKASALSEIMLGRSSSCEIVINDKRISSQHCRLYYVPSVAGGQQLGTFDVFVEDMSSNGTWINTYTHLSKRKRKQSVRQLYSGDKLSLLNPMRREKKGDLTQYQTTKNGNRGSRRETVAEIGAVPACEYSVPVCGDGNYTCNCTKFTFIASSGLNSFRGPSHSFEGMKENVENFGTWSEARLEKKPMKSNICIYGPSIFDFYTLLDVIGSGTSGVVWLGQHKETGREVAVKVIQTRKFQLTPGLSPKEIAAEAELLRGITHPNIVKLEDVFMDASNVYIILELVRGGDLFDRIVNHGCYKESTARKLMWSVLVVVQYLHDKDIVHRDLKPENILLMSPKNDVDVKITDFGLAKRTNQDGLKTFCGTPQYFAPEVLLRKNTICGAGRYGKEADMWSLGVIFFIVLSGTHPFHEHSLFDQIQGARYSFDSPEWQLVSHKAKDLVQSLLCANPSSRLTVSQALQHPFFKSLVAILNVVQSDDNDRASFTPAKGSLLPLNKIEYNTAAGGARGGKCEGFNSVQAGHLQLVRGSGCGLVVRHIVTGGDDPNKDDDISEYSSDDATSCIPPKKTSRLRKGNNAKSKPAKVAIKRKKKCEVVKMRRAGGGSAKALHILDKISTASATTGSVHSENNKKTGMRGYQTTLKNFLNPRQSKLVE